MVMSAYENFIILAGTLQNEFLILQRLSFKNLINQMFILIIPIQKNVRIDKLKIKLYVK